MCMAMAVITTKPLRMLATEIFLAHREAIRQVVAQHHHLNPRLIGAVLYGEELSENDLDLLVEAQPNATLQDLGAIQFELEKLLGVPVEVLTSTDLPGKIRDRVLREAVPV
jgi:predicted nucleotidyltransferase